MDDRYEKKGEVLFHYTSLESFFRIVTTGFIALNDVLKSNDPAEGTYSIKMLEKAYIELYNEQCIDRQQYEKFHRAFFDFNMDEQCFDRLQHVVLSLSVCEPNLPLALWRAYGDNGRGAAIGISKKKLEEIGNKEGFAFEQIKYRSKEQLLKEYKEFWLAHKDDEEEELISEIDKQYINGYFIKREENSYECEWRLVYTGVDLRSYSVFEQEVPENIDAYPKQDDMVLYYKLAINKEKIIDTICMGPQCKITDNEMRLLMDKYHLGSRSVCRDDTVMR